MGLTVYYQGSIKSPDLLPELIEEVQDIANTFEWQYTIYENSFPPQAFGQEAYNDKIYGIHFTIPDCESAYFCFLSNGKMSSPAHLKFWGNDPDPERRAYLYMLFTKTQFAGPKAHKLLIHLFRHISNKYLADFTLTDEGDYWETEDVQVLEKNFARYTSLINSFQAAIESEERREGESWEDFFGRITGK